MRDRTVFETKSVIVAFGAGAIWGLYTVFSKAALSSLGPEALGFWIMVTANIGFLVQLAAGGRAREIPLALRVWPFLGLMGILSGTLNLASLVGLRLTSATNAGVLTRSDVLFSVVLGWVLLRERLTVREGLGSGLMVAGTLAVSGTSFRGFHLSSVGDLYLLVTAFLLAVNAFVIKYKLSGLSGPTIAFYNSGIAAVCFVLAGMILGDMGGVAGTLRGFWNELMTVSLWSSAGGAFFLCILINFVQYLLYYYALEHLPVWFVRVTCLISPVVTALGGAMMLGEVVTLQQALGMAGVVAGAALILVNVRKGARPVQQAPSAEACGGHVSNCGGVGR